MKSGIRLGVMCGLFAVLGRPTAAGAADYVENIGGKHDARKIFSVPFFMEQSSTSPGQLWAKFTLAKPAILESYSGDCTGNADNGLIGYDPGPIGLNGTVGAPGTPDTGLAIGTTSVLNLNQFVFDHPTSAAGTLSIVPPTHLGLPIKSEVDMYINPQPGNFLACSMVFVFRAID